MRLYDLFVVYLTYAVSIAAAQRLMTGWSLNNVLEEKSKETYRGLISAIIPAFVLDGLRKPVLQELIKFVPIWPNHAG